MVQVDGIDHRRWSGQKSNSSYGKPKRPESLPVRVFQIEAIHASMLSCL